jgi:hypothetical protein
MAFPLWLGEGQCAEGIIVPPRDALFARDTSNDIAEEEKQTEAGWLAT